MSAECYLIVNADDFGQSPGVNRGIIRAHERGIVTSASLMVRWPAAAEAAAYAHQRPRLALGLHVDLGEWFWRDDQWFPRYEVVDQDDTRAVTAELARQIEAFRRLTGRDPDHIDSHQHFHSKDSLRPIFLEAAGSLGVPLRHCDPEIRYCGAFYGQTAEGFPYPSGISRDNLIGVLKALPPGITELGCHPGDGSDLDSTYASERSEEVKTLCSPRVRATVKARGIRLVNFSDVADASARTGYNVAHALLRAAPRLVSAPEGRDESQPGRLKPAPRRGFQYD